MARKRRTENFVLKLLNSFRLVITYLLTGKYINFGNYSCFYSKNLKKILNDNSTSLAYCATLQKHEIIKIYIDKKKDTLENQKLILFFYLIIQSI